MNDNIVIACACDDKYAGYCGIMITSVFENNRNNKVEVNIITDGISSENLLKMKTLEEKYGQKINVVNIDKSHFESLPIGNFKHISLCTYYRLLLPSLFNISKILYLDCDIIVRNSLSDLWNTDLDGKAVAAIPDNVYMIKKCLKRLGYTEKDSYHNAGVSLYNLEFLREFDFERKVHDFITYHRDLIVFHDQDIINAVCHGYYVDLSVRWNMMEGMLKCEPNVRKDLLDDLHKWQNNPSIIHYAAMIKPWHKECKHIYKSEFFKYKSLSPWNDLPQISRFENNQEKFKYYAKRYLIMLRDIRHFGKFRFERLSLESCKQI